MQPRRSKVSGRAWYARQAWGDAVTVGRGAEQCPTFAVEGAPLSRPRTARLPACLATTM